jgi:hypothetical protein
MRFSEVGNTSAYRIILTTIYTGEGGVEGNWKQRRRGSSRGEDGDRGKEDERRFQHVTFELCGARPSSLRYR